MIIIVISIQSASWTMSSTPKPPSLFERPRAVLRMEWASDELLDCTQVGLPRRPLASRGHKVSSSHGPRWRRLGCVERVVTVSALQRARDTGSRSLALGQRGGIHTYYYYVCFIAQWTSSFDWLYFCALNFAWILILKKKYILYTHHIMQVTVKSCITIKTAYFH